MMTIILFIKKIRTKTKIYSTQRNTYVNSKNLTDLKVRGLPFLDGIFLDGLIWTDFCLDGLVWFGRNILFLTDVILTERTDFCNVLYAIFNQKKIKICTNAV
jgi:hypothetical protein